MSIAQCVTCTYTPLSLHHYLPGLSIDLSLPQTRYLCDAEPCP